MPLMSLLFFMQFANKITLSPTSVPSQSQANHLAANQFRWIGTVIYLSFLSFEHPQNFALQYFPVSKWMSINIFVWSVTLCAHATYQSLGSQLVVRIVLGACEGAITAGFLIVTSVFYTRTEQALRVLYYFLLNGFAVIVLGLIAFGAHRTRIGSFDVWEWILITTGTITLATSVAFWFFFPDSPASASFLTPEEQRLAVTRIEQASRRNRQGRLDRLVEMVLDRRMWMFILLSELSRRINSMKGKHDSFLDLLNLDTLQGTFLDYVDTIVQIVTIYAATKIAAHLRINQPYAAPPPGVD